MDNLYIEKWTGPFNTSGGTDKFPAHSLWRYSPESHQITRLAQWVFFPWGGEWEKMNDSIKPAKIVSGEVYKIAQKHSHPLAPVATPKLLSPEQLEGLEFLLQYPERGWANYRKFLEGRASG